MRVMRTVVIVFIVMTSPVMAQQVVESGAWRMVVEGNGPGEISFNGQALIMNSRVSGFLPSWQGVRFHLGESTVEVTENGASWTRRMPDNQDAVLTVTAEGNTLTFTLHSTVTAPGPTEWSVPFYPEALRAGEKHCVVLHNDALSTLDLVNGFAGRSWVNGLVFEQPQRSVQLRFDSALLQDRRDRDAGLYWVTSLNHDGENPQEFHRTLEVEIVPADPADFAAREAVLLQIPTENIDVPVPNGGFEDETPLAHWSPNPRAAIDREEKRSGLQSARITIPADQEDRTGIYLTTQVPVQGGFAYKAEAFVKTRQVMRKILGDMSPTGATIILEWADRDGNWLAPGNYADGLYGDNNWKQVSTREVRAPLEAGYAVIFLSLRATGTAWFDDVKLTEVRHNLVLREPLYGAQIADNTPVFSWFYAIHGEALVELSPDPQFPEENTVTLAGDATSRAVIEDPIAPGTWYWRVSKYNGALQSAVWHFEQTAPITQDCTPPVIAPDHAFLDQPRTPVTVRFGDNVAVTGVKLVLNGRDITTQAKVEAERAVYTPEEDWQPGLHRLDVQVHDAAGNSAARRIFLNRLHQPVQRTWLSRGGIAFDGEPRFLLGMYGVRIEDMPEMAHAGIDFVHNYNWDGPGTNETALEYLDACHRHGLMAFIGFHRERLRAFDEEFVAERIGALSSHPALMAWYLFDEPDLPDQFVPPHQMRDLYQLVKSLDPTRPVIVTIAQRNLMPEYYGCYDVYWSMDYRLPAHNITNFTYHRNNLPEDMPLMSIVHCYDDRQRRGQVPEFDVADFRPTARQMHAAAFMQIVHESSGLCWWWWGQGGDLFMTVAHAPEAWAGLRETIRRIRELAPVLSAQLPARTWIEQVAEDREVHLWEKTLPDRTVIIAVNRDDEPCEAVVRSAALRDGEVRVLFEDRTVQARDGELTDSFAGWDVHVYEVR